MRDTKFIIERSINPNCWVFIIINLFSGNNDTVVNTLVLRDTTNATLNIRS